jgi:hypothetical protein
VEQHLKVSLFSLCLKANAEMVPKAPLSCSKCWIFIFLVIIFLLLMIFVTFGVAFLTSLERKVFRLYSYS